MTSAKRYAPRKTTTGQHVVMDTLAGKVIHFDVGSEHEATRLAQDLNAANPSQKRRRADGMYH